MTDFIKKKARPEIFSIKPYVPGKPIDEVKRELGLEDIIKLASNENPLGPSPAAVAAISTALPKLQLYPDANCYYLKAKIAAVTGLNQDNVVIGNGSDELLKLIAETFLNKDDNIIFANPSFSEYEFTARIMGAQCIAVPLTNFTHDLDAMVQAITPQTKLIYICNPNNPTGTIVTSEQTDAFMRQIPEDILVIFDEAYYEYVDSKSYSSGIKYINQGRNVIVLRTFSKIYGLASLRVGYGLTTPAIAGAIERVTEPFNVNTLAQVGALAAIDDQDHVLKSHKVNSAGKEYLYAEFDALGLKYVPTEANFIFVDTGRNCQEVFSKLLAQGVIVRSGDIFGYDTFIRVTVGTQEENARFISSLKKVLEA
ncbi:MAG: histidinol-phosphate transaminase [Syntrophomonadaceae bacterium]|jgi:histidinol-phosphate aminotransferase